MTVLYTSASLKKMKCLAFNMGMNCVRTVSHARSGGAKFGGRNVFNIFDSKTPDSVRIKAFKNTIYQSAMGKGKTKFSAMEINLITSLVRGYKGEGKKNAINPLQTNVQILNKLLLTHRLTDKDILEGMNLAAGPVNVAIPRDITPQEEKKKVELRNRKAENMDLHPSRKMHIKELLHSLNVDMCNDEEVYQKISLYLQKNEESRTSVGASQQNHVDIDINSLKRYLQNIEKKARQKSAIDKQKKNQARIYQWNTQSFSEIVPLSAGNILFKREPNRLWKRLQNGISVFLGSNGGGKKSKTTKKVLQGNNILLHSLENNKDMTLSNNFDHSVFNINFTDLFGVINASGSPPDRVLNEINEIELKGWKCVGNLYDNNKIVVFQSSNPLLEDTKIPQKSFTNSKRFLISLSALLASFFAYYRYRLSQRQESKK
ncbi:hypothetical protein H802_YJM1356P00111 [Saccharomyces cerevisiae YJM1356]|nr:hypothetical protein H802_YJM1356P00111 [Saccharomyces cerevisiae YJM1356]AJW05631.1 hypothetical protein H814_YJM1415P00106 [Saccharomyces cerevisiae YJM1415]CAI4824146.1 BBM_1a_G0053340.mRNA.1.CDS.1 [Saccharomyces cerevisiae]CAI7368464.1 BBM_1a_G0053340.mRNA.1.CDS.1 [Saccharomyces cerevisiae]